MVKCEWRVACDECGLTVFWHHDRKQVIREAKEAGWYVKNSHAYCPRHKPERTAVPPHLEGGAL